MKIFDNAIAQLDRYQADVGATTNQLERVIAVNDVTRTNVLSAESNIRG